MPSNLGSQRVRTIFGLLLFMAGCAETAPRPLAQDHSERLYPRPPQPTWAVALGNVQNRSGPSESQVQVAMFLFGEAPPPGLAMVKPGGLAIHGDDLLICDGPLSAVLRHDIKTGRLSELRLNERLKTPAAVAFAPNGDLFVADAGADAVLRFDSGGGMVSHLTHPPALRPSGVACVRDKVWVSSLAGQCLEEFDGTSGRHLRTIGSVGAGRGQFSFPMGISVGPDGNVYIADMLNHRVQVLSPDGQWIRDIGRAGDCVGCFGRPRDVAVGPDGTVFVTDTSAGRIHAFDPQGRPLLAFGEPDGGIGALVTPSGICISRERPGGEGGLPPGFEPAYYILVTEQMFDPGVRVYAWRGGQPQAGPAPLNKPGLALAAGHAASPHWEPDRCNACHTMEGSRALAIAPQRIDALCLSCHDGQKARSEAHPIGRLATTATVHTPSDWPTVEGRIGCATCHEFSRHCDRSQHRPMLNSSFVRAFDVDQPSRYCLTCHQADSSGRFNPHKQTEAGQVKQSMCLVCHQQEMPTTGQRTADPNLRSQTSQLCLNCHGRHWDVSPIGHVDRPASKLIMARVQRLEHRSDGKSLPLSQDKVTCWTCHNPHEKDLFGPSSALGNRATYPDDAAIALRMNRMELCLACHRK